MFGNRKEENIQSLGNKAGERYAGEWAVVDNRKVRQGRGIRITAKCNVYEGYFLDNKAYGTGRKIWDKSEKGNMVTYYTGEFSDGLKHGKGYYQFKEGTYYDG